VCRRTPLGRLIHLACEPAQVSEEGAVEVNLIYEPEQEGAEDTFKVMEDTLEDARADAIAGKLGYVKVGIVRISSPKPEPPTRSP